MLVRDATRKAPVTAPPETPLHEAARLMDSKVVGALVVVDGDAVVGMVTDRDLVVHGLARREPHDARLDSVMTSDPLVIEGDADARDAIALFRTHAVRRLPVVEEGRLVGLLAVDDLLIDLISDLGDVVRPITGEVVFGYSEAKASRSPTRP
ncbi:MAG: CBS domain-containing protein [Acidimicrobiia bacterium]